MKDKNLLATKTKDKRMRKLVPYTRQAKMKEKEAEEAKYRKREKVGDCCDCC